MAMALLCYGSGVTETFKEGALSYANHQGAVAAVQQPFLG